MKSIKRLIKYWFEFGLHGMYLAEETFLFETGLGRVTKPPGSTRSRIPGCITVGKAQPTA